ncbi:MAG: hypothetical protein LBB24_03170 [Rickettsiales bacterium]|jgi:hypothetical protein|nr:hypothetical protein [Rickettsiales bacterium]
MAEFDIDDLTIGALTADTPENEGSGKFRYSCVVSFREKGSDQEIRKKAYFYSEKEITRSPLMASGKGELAFWLDKDKTTSASLRGMFSDGTVEDVVLTTKDRAGIVEGKTVSMGASSTKTDKPICRSEGDKITGNGETMDNLFTFVTDLKVTFPVNTGDCDEEEDDKRECRVSFRDRSGKQYSKKAQFTGVLHDNRGEIAKGTLAFEGPDKSFKYEYTGYFIGNRANGPGELKRISTMSASANSESIKGVFNDGTLNDSVDYKPNSDSEAHYNSLFKDGEPKSKATVMRYTTSGSGTAGISGIISGERKFEAGRHITTLENISCYRGRCDDDGYRDGAGKLTEFSPGGEEITTYNGRFENGEFVNGTKTISSKYGHEIKCLKGTFGEDGELMGAGEIIRVNTKDEAGDGDKIEYPTILKGEFEKGVLVKGTTEVIRDAEHRCRSNEVFKGIFDREGKLVGEGEHVVDDDYEKKVSTGLFEDGKLVKGKIIHTNYEMFGYDSESKEYIYEGQFNNGEFEGTMTIIDHNGEPTMTKIEGKGFEGVGTGFGKCNGKGRIELGAYSNERPNAEDKKIGNDHRESPVSSLLGDDMLLTAKSMLDTITNSKPCSYEGDIESNIPHGEGTFIYENGVRSAGRANYGRLYGGRREITMPNGATFVGYFDDSNKLCGSITYRDVKMESERSLQLNDEGRFKEVSPTGGPVMRKPNREQNTLGDISDLKIGALTADTSKKEGSRKFRYSCDVSFREKGSDKGIISEKAYFYSENKITGAPPVASGKGELAFWLDKNTSASLGGMFSGDTVKNAVLIKKGKDGALISETNKEHLTLGSSEDSEKKSTFLSLFGKNPDRSNMSVVFKSINDAVKILEGVKAKDANNGRNTDNLLLPDNPNVKRNLKTKEIKNK